MNPKWKVHSQLYSVASINFKTINAMRNFTKKVAVFAAIAITTTAGFAQTNYVHQVIVLNEGQYTYFDSTQVTPVTLGAYDPIGDSYSVFDTITTSRFGSDLLIDGDNLYVAADSTLYVYDKNTLQLTNSTTVKGIRKLAIWNDHILTTVGENGVAHNSYFRVYNKNTLSLIYELDTLNGPIYSVEGVSVVNDTAYIAINNALLDFLSPVGIIGIIDLTNQTYVSEVDMGFDGRNPDNLMVDGTTLYTLNNKDFSGSSFTEFNTLNRAISTVNADAPSGCGASVLVGNDIYYHRYVYDSLWNDVNSKFHMYNTGTQLVDSIDPNLFSSYGMLDDYINGFLYVTTTDFWSFGMVYKMQYNGTLIDSFAVSISPGTLALDIRTVVSVDRRPRAGNIIIYPTVVDDIIIIELENTHEVQININNSLGQIVRSFSSFEKKEVIDVNDLSAGVYFLSVKSESTHQVMRFVKL